MYGKKKSPAEKRSCYKMKPKSPVLRALKGNQHRLPEEIKEHIIKAGPTKYMGEEKGKPRLAVKKKATKKNKVEVPRIGVKKKVTAPAPTKYKNKKMKSNKPCPGCGTICPSCRGKK